MKLKSSLLKFIAFIAIMMMSISTVAFAGTGVLIDGKVIESEIQPFIENDRTFVPVRLISENLGATVGWDGETKTVEIEKEGISISLVIGETNATVNGEVSVLDVAPQIVNGNTYVPIRFIAEGFNCEVGWDADTQSVLINSSSEEDATVEIIKEFSIDEVPEYSGTPYVAMNNNAPYFLDEEMTKISFEEYSALDSLGRCGVAVASVGLDIMPTEDRESISSVYPTGWVQGQYDNVDGGYLYNRSHIIGFQLTGENANKENLITGTRSMNVDGMLPFENMVADYVQETGNHVYFRVTPVFEGSNLLATGVLMEAKSVEDNGEGIEFNVFCYNVQEGITINYADGTNSSIYASDVVEEVEATEVEETVIENEDISAIDTNGNGIVTISEAEAAGYEMPITSDHWLYKYMKDSDGDGVVGE